MPFAEKGNAPPAQQFGKTWADVDHFAWRAICDWPAHAEASVRHGGLDYAHLTRWFLWDKVGRSIRRIADPEGFAMEAAELGWTPEDCRPVQTAPVSLREDGGRRWLRALAHRLRRRGTAASSPSLPSVSRPKGTRQVFIPVPTPRTGRAAEMLATVGDVHVTAPAVSHCPTYGATVVGRPPATREPDWRFVSRLYSGMLEGLAAAGVPLLLGDAVDLQEQLVQQARQVLLAEAMLDYVRPDAMLLHGDNHPPFQYYVALGRNRGIPSIMLQHGLDCERHYLDEAYASAIAVWGPAREERYRRDSQRQPDAIAVTGNPEYDDCRAPEQIDASGDYWLWVGRPHAASKCYAPSRSPKEGLDILSALLAECAKRDGQRLAIKPHPYDTVEAYRAAIAAAGLEDRVVFRQERPVDLFPNTTIVFTEDSTAGLEAMFWGKPLVHVHFAPTAPTLPLVDYGAALPGFCPDTLEESIRLADNLSEAAADAMLAGQRRFLRDYAGLCDGRAAERVSAFLLQQVEGS